MEARSARSARSAAAFVHPLAAAIEDTRSTRVTTGQFLPAGQRCDGPGMLASLRWRVKRRVVSLTRGETGSAVHDGGQRRRRGRACVPSGAWRGGGPLRRGQGPHREPLAVPPPWPARSADHRDRRPRLRGLRGSPAGDRGPRPGVSGDRARESKIKGQFDHRHPVPRCVDSKPDLGYKQPTISVVPTRVEIAEETSTHERN